MSFFDFIVIVKDKCDYTLEMNVGSFLARKLNYILSIFFPTIFGLLFVYLLLINNNNMISFLDLLQLNN